MSKPTILLVPGSFALPEFYDEFFDKIRSKGQEIRGLHMPTVGLAAGEGRPGTPPTMYDDAAFINKEVERLADEGKDVIVIGHSYGGVPVTEGSKGLGKKERQARGKEGGIVSLAYMTCLVPSVGESAADMLAQVPEQGKTPMEVGDDGWMSQSQPEKTAAIIMQTIPLEEATAWVKKFPKHSFVSFTDKLTHPGYQDIPVSYLFCELDLCIPASIQQAEIDMMEKVSGNKVNVTSIKADHCPNFTAMQETVDWVVELGNRYTV